MINQQDIFHSIPQYEPGDKQKGPGRTAAESRVRLKVNDKIENRERMRKLCELAGSYSEAASLISEHAVRSCSKESIKAWTCNPGTSRARTCHDWAVQALESRLKFLGRIF